MMLRLAAALILFALPLRAEVEIKEVTSPGGITAWLVEEHELPFTALEIRFKGGTSVDQPGKRGAVNLMTGLIEEGAGDLDAQGFATARDDLAATFSFRANTDAVGVSARFLSENRDQAVALLRSALVEPRFDADALERVRGQVLSGLASDAKDPNALAGRAFDAAAFGDHPYGTPGDGTVESVTALTRDDIVAAHKGALARDRIYVSAVGDITAEDLGALLDRLLGDLPATGAEMPGQAEYRLDGGVTVVEFPTPQAVIAFGHEGITRDDPDFFAAYILNEVLGGGRFGARLMTEVREKRGLTYGIGTYLVPMDHAELYMGRFASGNAVVGQAIDIVKAEWAKAATEGITAEELAATKTYLTGSYPLRFDGNGPIADILVGMQMEDLPIDYPVTRNAKIEAVTLEDIKRVAARVLKPEALHFVVVGQPEGIASDG
ncbi:peptidase M16 [Cereibacter changlensis JA139]|uniref:Peptidase M16 n=2 Tax=Cereibacter changlensis TaxID=402884 RepID=A0A2T4K084_9RHOB|nr:pitrilysin family protein [Cereibacter changlensis]PTE23554.1 peptidase M16 [Cereibacter changlensis JA139]PZX58527.1 zinc protease [Cereibacter changlensis]